MRRHFLLLCFWFSCGSLSVAQYPGSDWPEPEVPSFEIYTLASGMATVDATPTLIIRNPTPGQNLGFTPDGFASGARVGFVWRHENVGLVADLGFHKYADHHGSTSLAPLMLGLRFYSHERFRTSAFAEGLAGAYRWTERSNTATFVTGKGIVAAGAGVDVRLTHSLVFRLGEYQLMIAGARAGPQLTASASSGFAFRF